MTPEGNSDAPLFYAFNTVLPNLQSTRCLGGAVMTSAPLARVLSALGYAGTHTGSSHKCHCPAHEDNTESLSVSEGAGGKILLKCFAGCDTKAVLNAVGLNFADLSVNGTTHTNGNGTKPQGATKPRSKDTLGPIVATYDYRAVDGTVVHQTTRHEPKKFRQRQPDGKGGWIWNLNGIEPVLYRLPELLVADMEKWVYVTEGEKDADNLRTLGAIATCNPMGAGKWRDSYSETLAGCKVCILPDNDAPGRDHADKVAHSLASFAAEVRIIRLPGLPEKGDVSDWFAAGGTVEKLLALLEDTPTSTPPLPDAPAKSKSFTTSAETMQDLAALGYTFALNQLDDVIEVNAERLDDGLAAKIRTQMRDLGHKAMPAMEDAYMAAAYEQRYHPVRKYLDSLTWGGENHLERLCLHVQDKHAPIVYPNGDQVSVFKVWLYRWMLATVAKAYQKQVQSPVIVLDGNQGLGKSRLAAFLGSGLPEMFIEAPIHPDDKEHDRYLATRWIWEIAELGATTRRADREALKAFVTKNDVTFRKPYGKHPITKPSLANFIGTINNEAGFLTDPTGDRRFLVVTIDKIDWQYEESVDVHQLWAQIVADYKAGTRWELTPVEQKVRDAMNKGYERADPTEDRIVQCFDIDPAHKDWFMFTSDIADYLRTMGARDSEQALYNGIGTALRRMKMNAAQKTVGGQRGRGYQGICKKDIAHPAHPAHPENE